jgi:hypothetical protein
MIKKVSPSKLHAHVMSSTECIASPRATGCGEGPARSALEEDVVMPVPIERSTTLAHGDEGLDVILV